MEKVVVLMADLTFQQEQCLKIQDIIYDRILTSSDYLYKDDVVDIIEEHVKQAVQQFFPENDVNLEQVLADERTNDKQSGKGFSNFLEGICEVEPSNKSKNNLLEITKRELLSVNNHRNYDG